MVPVGDQSLVSDSDWSISEEPSRLAANGSSGNEPQYHDMYQSAYSPDQEVETGTAGAGAGGSLPNREHRPYSHHDRLPSPHGSIIKIEDSDTGWLAAGDFGGEDSSITVKDAGGGYSSGLPGLAAPSPTTNKGDDGNE